MLLEDLDSNKEMVYEHFWKNEILYGKFASEVSQVLWVDETQDTFASSRKEVIIPNSFTQLRGKCCIETRC
jgi:hypothetical protein